MTLSNDIDEAVVGTYPYHSYYCTPPCIHVPVLNLTTVEIIRELVSCVDSVWMATLLLSTPTNQYVSDVHKEPTTGQVFSCISVTYYSTFACTHSHQI